MSSLAAFAEANFNGWSMLAINASADTLTRELSSLPEFISLVENVRIQPLQESESGDLVDADGNLLTVTVHPDHRCVAILEPVGCEWTVILRSTDFTYEADIVWVRETAKYLSRSLATKALACWGEVECDFHIFDRGRSIKRRLGVEVAEASKMTDGLAVTFPACFIAGDPPQVWAEEATRQSIRRASLLTVSVTAAEASSAKCSTKLPAERMVASQCLEIIKLNQHVPFEVRSEHNSFETTVERIVFDPLQIDEVNHRFRAEGFLIDNELMKVIAVNADGSILLWYGISVVYHLRKGEAQATLALNDILALTFPFKIKNKKAEIDGLLAQLRELDRRDAELSS